MRLQKPHSSRQQCKCTNNVSSDLPSSLFHPFIFQTANRWTAEWHVDATSQRTSLIKLCKINPSYYRHPLKECSSFSSSLIIHAYILIMVCCLHRRGKYEPKIYKAINITLAICSVKNVLCLKHHSCPSFSTFPNTVSPPPQLLTPDNMADITNAILYSSYLQAW